MKVVILLISSLLATNVFAASVNSARLDAQKKNILIDVTYGGGCGEHDFFLKLKGCLESFPVQCRADLIEKTTDGCEALISDTVVISLAKYGLTDSYFKDGFLTIYGDRDWQTNKASQATIRLP